MSTNNTGFYEEISKIIMYYHQIHILSALQIVLTLPFHFKHVKSIFPRIFHVGGNIYRSYHITLSKIVV